MPCCEEIHQQLISITIQSILTFFFLLLALLSPFPLPPVCARELLAVPVCARGEGAVELDEVVLDVVHVLEVVHVLDAVQVLDVVQVLDAVHVLDVVQVLYVLLAPGKQQQFLFRSPFQWALLAPLALALPSSLDSGEGQVPF